MNKGLLAGVIVVIVIAAAGFGTYAYLTAPTKGPSSGRQGQMMPPQGGPGGNRQPPAPLAQATAPTADTVTPASGQTLYTIVSASSTATFTLDEQLRGEPKTVVGTSTGMVAGEIGYDKTHPASSTIGTIKLNARTFVTDDNSRNNMIRRAILKTEDDANEFITFTPSMTVATGDNAFDVTGDLTIAGITKTTVFHVTTTEQADGSLIIHGVTTVKRADFNLSIPNIPFIANVTDDVKLDLNLVATK